MRPLQRAWVGLVHRLADRMTGIAARRPPDFVIGGPERPYMRRWWLIPRNRFFNVYLHQILRDDDDRALHDHPWVNASLILLGGYFEVLPTKGATLHRVLRKAGAVKLRRPTAAHRLEVAGGECWTLFITGPTVHRWGFWCDQGFVHWKRFVHPDDPGQVGPGCAG